MPQSDEYTNHCPFGCEGADLYERAYCRHLVGFSNDGKTMEPVEKIMAYPPVDPDEPDAERIPRWNGNVRVNGRKRQKIQKGDKLVNPEEVQIIKGARQIAKLWVSSRVYRKDVPDDPPREELYDPNEQECEA